MARPGFEPGTPRFSVVGPQSRKLANLQVRWFLRGARDPFGSLRIPGGLGRQAVFAGPNPGLAQTQAWPKPRRGPIPSRLCRLQEALRASRMTSEVVVPLCLRALQELVAQLGLQPD